MSLSLLQNKASVKGKVVRLSGRPPDRGVCSILSSEHGLDARPGQSDLTCPFCGHKAFGVKGDDSLGKCFHPSCGRYVTPYRGKDLSGLYRVHEEIFRLCRAELLEKRDGEAWRYLTEERKIHPRVVELAPLGLVPQNFKAVVSGLFSRLIEEAQVRAEELKSNRPGRPKSAATAAANQVALVEEAKGKAEKCFRDNAGWLCFFYRDERNRITSIKFRKPGTKERFYYKTFQRPGLFGAEFWTPFESTGAPEGNRLIVVEGEFNALQLWSAAARFADSIGKEPKFHHVCATGGSSGCDWRAVKALCPTPLIWRDNDNAGWTMVESASETMTVDVIVSSVDGQDPDEFIKAASPDPGETWRAIRDLFQKKKSVYRTFAGIAAEIYACRQRQEKDKRREFEINSEVAALVREDLLERGTFYRNITGLYYFSNETKRLIILDEACPDFIVLMGRYGLNKSESTYRYVVAELVNEGLENGTETAVHRLAHYDPADHVLYVPDHNGGIYRITSKEIAYVSNGIDGILFMHDPHSEPYRYSPELLEDEEIPLLDQYVAEINFSDDDAYDLPLDDKRLLFTLWIQSLFFSSIMRTKAIMTFVGEKGSFKTSTLRKLLWLLFGPKKDVTAAPSEQKDMEAALTNNSVLILDNLDHYQPWLEDLLAIAATMGNIPRRLLYTTNTLADYPVDCFVAITTRTPAFRRDDVADRLILMKVKRVEEFRSEAAIAREFMEKRDLMMTELLQSLQRIVIALEDSEGDQDSCSFRMADFAIFCLRVARISGPEMERKVREIFDRLVEGQVAFSLEQQPLVDLMISWAEEWDGNDKNSGRWISNADLCNELAAFAKDKGLSFEYRDKPWYFARHFPPIQTQMKKSIFNIEKRTARGRKTLFRYQLRGNDAQKDS